MENKIRGRIYKILDVEERNASGKDYKKQAIILDSTTYDHYTGEPRTNFPKLEFNGDRGISEIAKCRIGSLVEVSFALNGAMYEKGGEQKNFTVVRGYKIELLGEHPAQTETAALAQAAPSGQSDIYTDNPTYGRAEHLDQSGSSQSDISDDLPF